MREKWTKEEVRADKSMQGLRNYNAAAAAIIGAIHLTLACEDLGLSRDEVLTQIDHERGKAARSKDVF